VAERPPYRAGIEEGAAMFRDRAVRRTNVVDLLDVIDEGDEHDIDLLVDALGLARR